MVDKKIKINKVLIIAPFWGRSDHVGCYRIERFIRWLNGADIKIILVKAGTRSYTKKKIWGTEISIEDNIGVILKRINNFALRSNLKSIFNIQKVVRLILTPLDEYYNWSKKVHKNILLKENINDVNLIISSSPPHSSHIAAFALSKKYSIPALVDLRDGWLDEPLQKSIKSLKIRNYFEEKLEKKILLSSYKVFLTSKVWKEKLDARLPQVLNKTIILTNGYFIEEISIKDAFKRNNSVIKLLYTGRFTKSIYLRKPSILFEPLYSALLKSKIKVNIELLSDLNFNDKKEIQYWHQEYSKVGSDILISEQLEKNRMYEILSNSTGLLLLSFGEGSIPIKLYDYIKSKKPILAVTLETSAVWQIGYNIPQMFLYDYSDDRKDYSVIIDFLEACKSGNYEINVPEEYSDEYLSKIFLETLQEIKN